MLNGSLARSVTAQSDPDELEEPVRVFAHDTLLDHARKLYEPDLPRYLALLDRWAQEYQEQGWPAATPPYLLRPYTRHLANQALDPVTTPQRFRHVTEMLYQIVAHPARSTLLLQRTGNPADYDQEITATQRLLVDARERTGADDNELVYRLAVLALARRPLSGILAGVAVSVCSVWAQAGRFRSALALAAGIEDPVEQTAALAQVAGKLAEAGHGEQAVQAATGIEDPYRRAEALADIARRLAEAGHADQAASVAAQAAQVATGIEDPGRRAWALEEVATTLAWPGYGGHDAGLAAQAVQIRSRDRRPRAAG